MDDTERPTTSLASNVLWSGLAQAWSFALSVVSVLVLARLLGPEDFAVIAVVIPIIGLLQIAQTLGFNSAIVQIETITKPQLNTLFAINIAMSLALAVALVLLAEPIARLLDDPRLVAALIATAIVPPLYAFASQPYTLLLRQLRFKAIALCQIGTYGLHTATGILGAWITGSYWALIAAQVVSPVGLAISYAFSARWLPGRPGPLADVRPLFPFGFSVWAASLFNYVSRNTDNLIVGYAATPRELGLYDRSYRALTYPINQTVTPLGQVLVPTLTRCVADTERYRSHYWATVTFLLLLYQPVLLSALFNPVTLIGLILGPDWLEAATLFAWFAGAGLFQIFQATLGWLLVSQGRGGDLLRLNVVTSVVALTSFLVGIQWGVEGLAKAYVLGQLVLCLPYGLWLTGRSGPIDHRGLLLGLMPHIVATAAAAVLVVASRYLLGSPLWPLLIATTVCAYGLYVAVLLALPLSRPLIASLAERGGVALVKAARRLR